MDFLKKKELCFGCLSAGHMSHNCGKRLTCRICSQHHPTVLHVDRNTANWDIVSKELELIGNNAPKMLEPLCYENGIRFVINGHLHAGSTEAETCAAVVNRISVCRLEEMLFKQYNHDFMNSAAEVQL